MGNRTLPRRDSYLTHVKSGIKPDTLSALRTTPLQLSTIDFNRVTSIDFKDFHIPIQEQSKKYLRFHIQGQTYQFKALPFGLSTAPMEFTVIAKGGKTDGCTQGYKDPPLPR